MAKFAIIMKTTALIAARSGSVRVKNKDIRPFAGSTLLEVKIAQLKRIANIDEVVVNSNDEQILKIAESCGAIPCERDAYYASNTVSMSEVYRNMAEQTDTDLIVYANCTNPVIKDSTIFDIIEFYKKNCERYDSVNTAHLVQEFLWKDGQPMNYDPLKQPRSQDLPEISALNFAVNVLSRQTMIDNMNVVGRHPFIFNIDEIEATDIDNPIDFFIAEELYKKIFIEGQGIL